MNNYFCYTYFINPRCACAVRVMVLVLCVCACVCVCVCVCMCVWVWVCVWVCVGVSLCVCVCLSVGLILTLLCKQGRVQFHTGSINFRESTAFKSYDVKHKQKNNNGIMNWLTKALTLMKRQYGIPNPSTTSPVSYFIYTSAEICTFIINTNSPVYQLRCSLYCALI